MKSQAKIMLAPKLDALGTLLDLDLAEAARMASANPAAFLGLGAERGRIVSGQAADLAERAGVATLHVSMSHSDLTAAAFVVGSSKDNLAR